MSKGAKIAIIVTLGVLAVFGTCVGAGVWWWSENKDELISTARDGLAEGAQFGRTASGQSDCIERGMELSAECGQMAIMCGTAAQVFTQGCLYTAPATDGVCAGVPGPTDLIDTVTWSTSQCQERGQTLNNFCGNVMGALQAYCAEPHAELPLGEGAP
jgi:hypothetical protein